MKAELLRFSRQHELLPPGSQVVCALSGGADSVALLRCLLELRDELSVQVSAAHFNHCLRGSESDEDEAFVRSLCRDWEVPLTVGRGDCAAFARQTGRSIEEAARVLRYEFLLSQPGLIATAHNADDQTETVLLNLLRGTGLRGLSGIPPKQDRLVRPLLTATRQQIEAFLTQRGLPHREDSSNGLDDALRNRLRHHVTPLLRQENPGLSATVGRMTQLLRQEDDFLTRLTDRLLQQAARDGGWDCEILRDAEPVLRRRAIRQLLQVPKPAMTHVEQVERLLEDLSGSASVTLPGGVTAVREYGLLLFRQSCPAAAAEPVALKPGETVYLPWADLWVSLQAPAEPPENADQRSVFALKYSGQSQFLLRPRQTGDRLALPGGSKSLKRLMIDRKLPAARRDRTPVVQAGAYLAVYGLDADRRLKAEPGEPAAIIRFFQEERKT